MRAKLLRVPGFQKPGYFVPFGVATIYTHLQNKGFSISQDDLNIRHHRPLREKEIDQERSRLSTLFVDRARMMAYLGGGDDPELHALALRYAEGANWGGVDVLMLSVAECDLCSANVALLLARLYKATKPKGVVVIGGEFHQHAYVREDLERYVELGIVDYYVQYQGEISAERLLTELAKPEAERHLDAVPGLCYLKDGSVREIPTTTRPLIVPDFSGLPIDQYRWYPGPFFRQLLGKRSSEASILILPFQLVEGCPNRCAFCAMSTGREIFSLSATEAVDALERLAKRYRTRFFFWLDATLNISRGFTNRLCDELIRRKLELRWSDCASPRGVTDPGILEKMYRAGARRLIFGLESGSPRILKYIDKRLDVEQAARTLRWSHEAGIWTGLEVIAGLPHETEEDVELTVRFIEENAEYVDEIWLNRFYLIANSRLWNDPERFRITNFRPAAGDIVNLVKKKREALNYGFDEIGGLPWPEKAVQVEKAGERIGRVLYSTGRLPIDSVDHLHALFYLYEQLSDPTQVRDAYRQYADHLSGRGARIERPSAVQPSALQAKRARLLPRAAARWG